MRVNKFVALATGVSRRKADDIIASGQLLINNQLAAAGQDVQTTDTVTLNGQTLALPQYFTTILLHKPVGYVCSRDGQGSRTIYELLPAELHNLKPVGRLDKDSSGLLLLTNDGNLAQSLTHPSHHKIKVYQIVLDRPLSKPDWAAIHEQGVMLDDGLSKLFLERLEPFDNKYWQITMSEGRNRQIRRTFAGLGYNVTKLHRIQFGDYRLGNLKSGELLVISNSTI